MLLFFILKILEIFQSSHFDFKKTNFFYFSGKMLFF